MSVSRETKNLESYAALIRKWNPAINLVSPATLADIETRHIADSLQLANASATADGTWADLGSGGGLPGIIMGISRPNLAISLVESDKRKCSFLRTVIRELGLDNISIVNHRIEAAKPLGVNNISARALAPLPLLMSYIDRHLLPNGTAWLMKGQNWQVEVDEARKRWSFDLIAHPSKTDQKAAILELTGIRHA